MTPDLCYDWTGAFRQYRVHACEAHNVDRVLNKILDSIGQKGGTTMDVHTLQGMFGCNYYPSGKLKDFF